MVDMVWVPEAALVPDHPPLARQLVATGFVDQVSTGWKLPLELVRLALRLTTPALCAAATPTSDRANAHANILFMTIGFMAIGFGSLGLRVTGWRSAPAAGSMRA
jgi:hypothetical protein